MKINSIQLKSLKDEELMVILQTKGNHEALTEIYNRYSKRLLGYFIKIFKGDIQKSQDFLQDLFVKVMEKNRQFNPDKKLYSWLFTIASNMCKTSFRKQADLSIESLNQDQMTIDGHQDFENQELGNLLKTNIYSLSDNLRLVFILRYVEGFSIKETAEITDLSEGTIKSRLYHATQKLASQLASYRAEQIK